MQYQPYRFSEKIPPLINLQLLLALAGGLLATVQALLILVQGKILCLNDGCEIVEQLTSVPQIVFNVVGGIFFSVVFLALWQGARGAKGGLAVARLLLIAAMAAEGVLLGFQYYVAEVFCIYCIVIFTLILLLNLLMGRRQLLAGLAVTGSVLLAFAGLQFVPHSQAGGLDLRDGVYARLERSGTGKTLHLFFSSSCPHCEDVIATIDEAFTCSLNFNPIDDLQKPPLESLVLSPGYSSLINRNFLKSIGISEIPVLMVRTADEMRMIKGKQAIMAYFDSNCRPGDSLVEEQSGVSATGMPGTATPFVPPDGGDETCSVEVDCVQEITGGGSQ